MKLHWWTSPSPWMIAKSVFMVGDGQWCQLQDIFVLLTKIQTALVIAFIVLLAMLFSFSLFFKMTSRLSSIFLMWMQTMS